MHASTASYMDGVTVQGSQKEVQSLQGALDQAGFEFTVYVDSKGEDRSVVFFSFVNRQSDEGQKAIETVVAFNELEQNPVEM
jgi:hypothetical protein